MDATTGESLRRSITVTNPDGLHLRPIQAFVELAGKFHSAVRLGRDDGSPPVNGKSALNLLGLAAECGTVLVLEVSGPDAREALEALAEILGRSWEELEAG